MKILKWLAGMIAVILMLILLQGWFARSMQSLQSGTPVTPPVEPRLK